MRKHFNFETKYLNRGFETRKSEELSWYSLMISSKISKYFVKKVHGNNSVENRTEIHQNLHCVVGVDIMPISALDMPPLLR